MSNKIKPHYVAAINGGMDLLNRGIRLNLDKNKGSMMDI
jgi:hypothetical protein